MGVDGRSFDTSATTRSSNDAIETHASRGRSARTNASASGVAGGKHFVSRTTVASPAAATRSARPAADASERSVSCAATSPRGPEPDVDLDGGRRGREQAPQREQVVGAMRLDLEAHVDNLPGEFVGGGRGTVERWLRLGGRREPMPHPDVRLDVHSDPAPHLERREHPGTT